MIYDMPKGSDASRYAVWALLIIVAVAYMLVPGELPPMGDDLAYMRSASEYHDGSVLWYPVWTVKHWLHVNGRLPNLISPIVLCWLPASCRCLLGGVFMAAMLWLMIRIAGMRTRQAAGCTALIAAVVLTLQWWDRFMLWMVILNYVFAAAMVLLFFGMLTKSLDNNRKSLKTLGNFRGFALGVFSFMAGMVHEAATLPLLGGIIVWLMVSDNVRRRFDRRCRIMLALFAAGAALCICNPAFLSRLGKAHDDTPIRLVLRSCYWLPVLMAVLLGYLAVRRKHAIEILKSSFTALAVAAVLCAPIVAVGGIVGRSGFFCQIYSITAIAMLVNAQTNRIPRWLGAVVTAVLFTLVTAHLCALVAWQREAGRQTAEVLALFKESGDGIVYYDYTRYDEMPSYLLGKTTGVPDDDDIYLIETIRDALGDSVKCLTILPTRLCGMQAVADSTALDNGSFVLSDMPCGSAEEIGLGRYIIRNPGCQEMVVVPIELDGRRRYYVTPRVTHPENPVYTDNR